MLEIPSHSHIEKPEEEMESRSEPAKQMATIETSPKFGEFEKSRNLNKPRSSSAWRKGLFTAVAIFGAAFGGQTAETGAAETNCTPENVIRANIEKTVEDYVECKAKPTSNGTYEGNMDLFQHNVEGYLGDKVKKMISLGEKGAFLIVEDTDKNNHQKIEGMLIPANALEDNHPDGNNPWENMSWFEEVDNVRKAQLEKIYDGVLKNGEKMNEDETYQAEQKWNEVNKNIKKNEEKKNLFTMDINGKHYYVSHDESGYRKMTYEELEKNPETKKITATVVNVRKDILHSLKKYAAANDGKFIGEKLADYHKINTLLPEKIKKYEGTKHEKVVADILKLKYGGYAVQRTIEGDKKEYIRFSPEP